MFTTNEGREFQLSGDWTRIYGHPIIHDGYLEMPRKFSSPEILKTGDRRATGMLFDDDKIWKGEWLSQRKTQDFNLKRRACVVINR